MRPRARRSATRFGIRTGYTVEIAAEAFVVDRRRTTEHRDCRLRADKALPAQRCELTDGHPIAGDDEGLAVVESPHDLPAVVAKFSLGDFLSHKGECSTPCYETGRLSGTVHGLNHIRRYSSFSKTVAHCSR